MQVSDLFIRRPVFSVVVSLLLMVGGLAALMQLAVREYPAGRPAGRLGQHHLQGRRERGHREPGHRAHRGLGRRPRGHSPDHLGEPERALLGDDRVLRRARPRRRRRRRARPRRAHHGAPARGRRSAGRAQGRFERRRDHVGRRHLDDARRARAHRVPEARLCRPARDRARASRPSISAASGATPCGSGSIAPRSRRAG